ncbi:MAG: hypothetical protein JW910_18535 [Anaerolineae bacterium]|nr:hypothetical protein [Anaerolineae bacterium]
MEQNQANKKVITVTLNPSLDRTLITHFLAVGYHNTTTEATRLDPAGRGVSVSRALHALGVSTHAIILVGHDATGRAYQALLTEEQFPITVLRREGRTRSNIVIRDTGLDNETVILEDSDGVSKADLDGVAEALRQLTAKGDTVVFAGSLPQDVPEDTYAWLVDVAQEAGAEVAINAGGGEALRQALPAEPELIYLTRVQVEGMFNIPVREMEDVIGCAQKLREQGAGKVWIALPDMDAALLVAEEGAWLGEMQELLPGTRSGQAEAMIAGYLAGRLSQRPLDEALEMGAAAAAFTGTQVGHTFGTLKDVQEYADQVSVTPVEDTPAPPENLDEDEESSSESDS